MEPPTPVPEPSDDQAVRDIPKWADRYARHRVLLVLLFMVVYIVAFALICGLSALAGLAWRADQRPLALVLAAADPAFCAWWAWLWLSRRRAIALTATANRWLYRKEGEVAPAVPSLAPDASPGVLQPTQLDRVVCWVFGVSLGASVIFGFCTDLELRYMQPINAAIAVPFVVYLCYRQRKFSTPLMFLWPGLYALHAILVLAGVPPFATLGPALGTSSFLVYGLFAVVVSHLYSRYALRQLRRVASTDEDQATGGQAQ